MAMGPTPTLPLVIMPMHDDEGSHRSIEHVKYPSGNERTRDPHAAKHRVWQQELQEGAVLLGSQAKIITREDNQPRSVSFYGSAQGTDRTVQPVAAKEAEQSLDNKSRQSEFVSFAFPGAI